MILYKYKMKYPIILVLAFLLYSACTMSQKCQSNDPEDKCRWVLCTSHYDQIGEEDTQGIVSIDIFVKEGNVLKWFYKSGMHSFYIMLDTYNKKDGWYNYTVMQADSVSYILADFSKKTVTLMRNKYPAVKIFKP